MWDKKKERTKDLKIFSGKMEWYVYGKENPHAKTYNILQDIPIIFENIHI